VDSNKGDRDYLKIVVHFSFKTNRVGRQRGYLDRVWAAKEVRNCNERGLRGPAH